MLNANLKDSCPKTIKVIHKIAPNYSFQYHFHDAYEVFLNMTDGTQFYLQDKVYEMKKGDLAIISNMDLHKFTHPKNVYERYILNFIPQNIQEFLSSDDVDLLECFLDISLSDTRCIHLNDEQCESLITLLKKIKYYYDNRNIYGANLYRKTLLVEVLLLINSVYRENNKSNNSVNENILKQIRPILFYIKHNLSEDLSLEELSHIFKLNKFILLRSFKKATGVTVSQYITNLRILKAKELLLKGNSVTKTAELVGFNSYTYFTTAFKKNVGVTPSDFLKRYKNKNSNNYFTYIGEKTI